MTLRALSISLALLLSATIPASADPTGAWRMTADMEARRDFTATLLDTGEVLVAGGRLGRSRLGSESCRIYDPLTDHWRQAASMPGGRARHSAIKLRSGKVLVAGGSRNQAGESLYPSRTALLYDPARDRWEVLSEPSLWSLNGFAAKPLMALLADGRVVAMNDHTSRDMRIFDPATKTWITDSHDPLIRAWGVRTSISSAQLTGLPDGRVLVAQTSDGGYWPRRRSAFAFDPNPQAGRRIAEPQGDVYPSHLAADPAGRIVGVDRYDTAVYLQSSQSSRLRMTRLGRLRHSVSRLACLPSGRIVAFNSAARDRDGSGIRFEVNLVDLDESTPNWRTIGKRRGAVRFGHEYVVLKSGEILLLGGYDSTYKPLPTYVMTISDEADRIKALQGSSGAASGITGALTPATPAQPAPSVPTVAKARIEGGQLEIEGQGFAGSDVRVYLGRRRLSVLRKDGSTRIVATLPAAAMTTLVRVRVDGRLSASVRLSQPAGAPKLSRAWRAGGVLVIEGSDFGSSVDEVRAFFGSRSLRVLWASPTRVLIERPSGRGRLQLEVNGLRSRSRVLR